ncbi:MAG: flagellar basal body-associated FliL family protein [Thiohalomonadales bacterium]
MAEAEDDAESESSASGSSKKLIIIISVVLLLIAGTVGGLFAAGVIGGGGHEDEEADEDDTEEPAGPAVYIPIEPAFVVNFTDTAKARFLQITMEAMTRNPDVPGQIENHLPAIRNNLVLLFSSQTYESISTLEGKEALREEALAVVQEILEEETGDPGIEAVYFTSIVMQ